MFVVHHLLHRQRQQVPCGKVPEQQLDQQRGIAKQRDPRGHQSAPRASAAEAQGQQQDRQQGGEQDPGDADPDGGENQR